MVLESAANGGDTGSVVGWAHCPKLGGGDDVVEPEDGVGYKAAGGPPPFAPPSLYICIMKEKREKQKLNEHFAYKLAIIVFKKRKRHINQWLIIRFSVYCELYLYLYIMLRVRAGTINKPGTYSSIRHSSAYTITNEATIIYCIHKKAVSTNQF
jgi:hypothetical protein